MGINSTRAVASWTIAGFGQSYKGSAAVHCLTLLVRYDDGTDAYLTAEVDEMTWMLRQLSEEKLTRALGGREPVHPGPLPAWAESARP